MAARAARPPAEAPVAARAEAPKWRLERRLQRFIQRQLQRRRRLRPHGQHHHRRQAGSRRPCTSTSPSTPRRSTPTRSAVISAWVTNGGWGLGHIQVDFSIDVYYADATSVHAPFTQNGMLALPDSDIPTTVPIAPGLTAATSPACPASSAASREGRPRVRRLPLPRRRFFEQEQRHRGVRRDDRRNLVLHDDRLRALGRHLALRQGVPRQPAGRRLHQRRRRERRPHGPHALHRRGGRRRAHRPRDPGFILPNAAIQNMRQYACAP